MARVVSEIGDARILFSKVVFEKVQARVIPNFVRNLRTKIIFEHVGQFKGYFNSFANNLEVFSFFLVRGMSKSG